MADFKKLKDGEGNSYNVKDAQARTDLASHTSNTSNPHSVTKAQVGLGNVDNTSDLNKPVSTAQQTALDLKIDKSSIKTSTPETPTDNDVPSIKYLEDTFAKASEFYETLGCGYALLAGNLDTNLVDTDTTPYLFRATGGADAEVANTCKVKKLIGGSLPIIQKLSNGNIETNTGWSSSSGTLTLDTTNHILKFTATSQYGGFLKTVTSFIKGHKYLISFLHKGTTGSFNIYSSTDGQSFSGGGLMNNVNDTTFTWRRKIVEYTAGNGGILNIIFQDNRASDWTEQQFKNISLIDITATFGVTVANRLAQLETAEDNSGIVKIKEILTQDYYPDNSTTITSVKTSGKETIEFNQWDEEWEANGINYLTGLNDDTRTNRIRSKNYIQVLPNTNYSFYITGRTGSQSLGWVTFYDENKAFIDRANYTPNSSIITLPSNCSFIRFETYEGYGTTYKNDVCIYIYYDNTRSGYEQFKKHPYPNDNIELKGVITLDQYDNWVYDGDTYANDGTHLTVRGEYTFTGNETWAVGGQTTGGMYRYYKEISDMASGNCMNGLCPKFLVLPSGTNVATYNGENAVAFGYANKYLQFLSATELTASQVATLFTNVIIQYPLAAPTTSSASSFQETQEIDNWGVERYIDNRAVTLPVGHETDYPIDILSKVEVAPDAPKTDGTYVMTRNNGENSYTSLATYLGDNNYEKVVDRSSDITLSSGITASFKKAYKIGNTITISAVVKNETGDSLSSYAALFTVASDMSPTNQYIVAYVEANNQFVRGRINPDKQFGVEGALANNGVVYINLSYCVA